MLNKNRRLSKPFYPLKEFETKNEHIIKKRNGEIRIVSMDIAVSAGKNNDNSVIVCFRLLPTTKGYQREVVYIESFNGINTEIQALRLKQIYYEFEADYVIIDYQSVGKGIYDYSK